MSSDRVAVTRPYERLRVLDAATLIAGPLAAALLGDWGADVVKVEEPATGDAIRSYSPQIKGVGLGHKVTNRNKRSLGLDLRRERGQALFRSLASTADVLITNFRPQTLQAWGLDYEDLARENGSLIVLHVTAYGRSGPYRERPGFARIAESYAGLAHITGFPDREPVLSGYPIVDAITGLYGAFAVSGAIAERGDGGRGGLIDLALYDGVMRLLEDVFVGVDPQVPERERVGNANPHIAPNDMYSSSDGGYIVIPASTDSTFRRLMDCIGEPSLVDDPRFVTNGQRVQHREELDKHISAWVGDRTRDDALRRLQECGVPAGPILAPSEILRDPNVVQRGNFLSVEDDETDRNLTMQAPVPLGSGAVRYPGRPLGADTNDVLQHWLGLHAEDIGELRSDGIVG